MTGPSVAKVSRVEDLTRSLARPLLATADFADALGVPGDDMGLHPLRGFDDPIGITAYDIGG